MSLLGSRELPGWSEEPDEACLSELTDVHAHPTDYRQFSEQYRDETGNISLGKLCAMSSNLGDQGRVEKLASDYPREILPAFNLDLLISRRSHVVLCCLLANKFRVCVIENFDNSFPEALNRVSKIALSELPKDASEQDKADSQVKVFKGDLKNGADVQAIFDYYNKEGSGIWGVIHIAALKAVGESAEKPIEYYQNNISATIGLFDIMRKNNCFRLVYSSSATVYGAPKQIPIPESSPMSAESVYGRTKVMAELIIKDIADSDPRWRALGLRYFNPAGAHPSGLIGEDPHGKPGNLVPLLAQMAVGKHAEAGLKVFGNDYPTPDGTCVRDYIHVMDLAGGHILCLEALDRDDIYQTIESSGGSGFGGSGGKYKAYNLGKGKGMSVLNMIEAMKKASGFDYKYEIIGRRTGDVPDLTADPAVAEKELGFKANRSLEEMCRDQWNWQSKNPNGYN